MDRGRIFYSSLRDDWRGHKDGRGIRCDERCSALDGLHGQSVPANQTAQVEKEIMVSAIILTKDEAQDLPDCLNSIGWIDDKIVVDSGSADETVRIADGHGARVFVNQFKSFGEQRNWALDHCSPKHDWILFVDADERSTPDFQRAMTSAIQSARDDAAGFYCCWKLMYEGVWLKRCDSFPKWQLRVLRKGRARFVD